MYWVAIGTPEVYAASEYASAEYVMYGAGAYRCGAGGPDDGTD